MKIIRNFFQFAVLNSVIITLRIRNARKKELREHKSYNANPKNGKWTDFEKISSLFIFYTNCSDSESLYY